MQPSYTVKRKRRPARGRRVCAILAATLSACSLQSNAFADTITGSIPAGVRVSFNVLAPITSNQSKTGDTFAFALLAPITAPNDFVATAGTRGIGTIYLAGHAGSAGHEGDLTLRLDSLRTADGRTITFADQRLKINGRNRKVASGVLGFVPFVGIGAFFIRGSEARIDPTTPIETVLIRPATITTDGVPTPITSPPPR